MKTASTLAPALLALFGLASPAPGQTPAAQPTDVDAFYRSGQTFITWTENSSPGVSGERYRAYRHTSPIDAGSLQNATYLGTVWEGSSRFWADMNHTATTYAPRYFTNFVIHDHGQELSATTGLLVRTHHAGEVLPAQTAYYAVTIETFQNGNWVENVQDFVLGAPSTPGPHNVVGPLTGEDVEPPLPVLGFDFLFTCPSGVNPAPGKCPVSGRIYIQYMDRRLWNETFHAPNKDNEYYGLQPPLLPSEENSAQYAYAYKVADPPPGEVMPQAGWPVVLNLHAHADSRIVVKYSGSPYPAVEIEPIDQMDTWWYGFAQDFDYHATGFPSSGDVIVNYTEMRILRTVHDLLQHPPARFDHQPGTGEFLDPNRVYVLGHSMGGSGALALALRYPKVFAAAYASRPMTDYEAFVTFITPPPGYLDPHCDFTNELQRLWGLETSPLPTQFLFAGSASDPRWREPIEAWSMAFSVWEWQNHASQISRSERLPDDSVPLGMSHGMTDDCILPEPEAEPFFPLAIQAKRTFSGRGDCADHGYVWKGLSETYRFLLAPGSQLQAPFFGLTAVLDESVPGFSNLAPADCLPDVNWPTVICPPSCPGSSDFYKQIEWRSSWNTGWTQAAPPEDTPYRWAMSFRTYPPSNGLSLIVDITPRRLDPQRFHVSPNQLFIWKNIDLSGGISYITYAQADANGLLTIPGFLIKPGGNRLEIEPY